MLKDFTTWSQAFPPELNGFAADDAKPSICLDHRHNHLGLVLSSNAKPRLKWTSALLQCFVDAVYLLGGPQKATPKTVMRAMGVPGLCLGHLKSHLQKYRLGRNQQSDEACGETSKEGEFMGLQQRFMLAFTIHRLGLKSVSKEDSRGADDTVTAEVKTAETENGRHRTIRTHFNEGLEIAKALQLKIEAQKKFHEQIEVQRHLQLQIEAQGKYLRSVLQKAQETLAAYNSSSLGLEAAKTELSELLSMVKPEYPTSFSPSANSADSALLHSQPTCYSMDSCSTSSEREETKGMQSKNLPVSCSTLVEIDWNGSGSGESCLSDLAVGDKTSGSTVSDDICIEKTTSKRPFHPESTGTNSKRARLPEELDLNTLYHGEIDSGP